MDANGHVYVADAGNNRIQKFDCEGSFIGTWGSLGSADGQFKYPLDVHVDAAGFVYVSDCFNYRVQKFTSDGVFLAKWGSPGNVIRWDLSTERRAGILTPGIYFLRVTAGAASRLHKVTVAK